MTKRNRFSLLVCVLAVLMLAGLMLPVEGRAEEMSDTGSAGEAVTWTLDNKGTLTISGTGEMTGAPWWTDYRTVIKKVVIEEGVTNVYSSAFTNCTSLAEVSLPSTLEKIGREAFDSCSALTAVVLPEGVTTLGTDAFENCSNLDYVTIPSTLTSLGAGL